MKITAKQYAEALSESFFDNMGGEETDTIIKKFAEVLKRNGDLGLSENIIEEFGKLWDEKEGVFRVEAVTVSEIDGDMSGAVVAYIKEETSAKNVKMENKIDKKILGGIVIKYGDKILDMSMKKRLEDFKKQIVK